MPIRYRYANEEAARLMPLKSHKSKTTIFKIHNSDGVSLFYKINVDLAPR